MKKLTLKFVVLLLLIIVCSYKNSPEWILLDEVILFDTITYSTNPYGNWTTRTHFIVKEIRHVKYIESEVKFKQH